MSLDWLQKFLKHRKTIFSDKRITERLENTLFVIHDRMILCAAPYDGNVFALMEGFLHYLQIMNAHAVMKLNI